MPSEIVEFELNGRSTEVMAGPLATLGHVLREQLQLQGGQGRLPAGRLRELHGAGRRRAGALVPAAGRERRGPVGARRSRASAPAADPLQQIFHERFAVQCGFCAPGMLIAARALLERNPSPTRDEIAEALTGNVCRCTGYESIIDAIAEAAA